MDQPITFYVSTDGKDTWSGKLPKPDSLHSDGPFATLGQARQAVRQIKAQGDPAAPVTVLLRGGKYYLDELLVLGAPDSGTHTAPVIWEVYPGEKAVLSGGRRVTGWQPYRGDIWQAELPGSRAGRWKFRQLFYKGIRQQQARFPRFDLNDPLYGGWAFITANGTPTSFQYHSGTFPHRWVKPSELEVVSFVGSGCWPQRVPVKSVDESTCTFTMANSGLQFDVPGWFQVNSYGKDNRFYVVNGLEDLTEPGDWCFDGEEGKLYFWFPEKDGAPTGEVVIPYLDCLVDLYGAKWVTLKGLTFTETLDGDNFHHEGVEGSGAMYPHPGWRYGSDAVHLKDAEHCSVEECSFDQVGMNGVYLEGYNFRNRILRNEFSQAGANAVCLLGTRLKHPLFNEVSDNYIHDCGVLNKYTAGIFLGMSDGNLISHNQLERLPHHAVNLSNSPYGRNVVEYNQIRFADQEVNDSGAINCWMEEPPDRDVQRCGHVIRFNFIADTYACAVTDSKVLCGVNTFSNGIYLDNYTSNCFVYGNIVIRASSAGIVIHAGKNNWIENNILIDCLYSLRPQDFISGWDFWKPMAGFMTGNTFIRNICSQQAGTSLINLYNWSERTFARCDENLYFLPSGEYQVKDETIADPSRRVMPMVVWHALGFDVHSLQAEPQFVDASQDDYRLEPGSPAWKLGFSAIEVSKIGVQPR
jgi:parallel beta-helix repeat protein